MSQKKNNNMQKYFYRASAADFCQIPGNPLGYWVSDAMRSAFELGNISRFSISNGQNKTADNDKYVRFHWEVASKNVGLARKWFLYAKGGEFRKWAGNLECVVDWSEEARSHYRKDARCRIIPEELWEMEGVTWSRVSSASTPPAFRYLPQDATFDMVGSSIFIPDENDRLFILSVLNSSISNPIFRILNPTVDIQVKDVQNVPLPRNVDRGAIVKNALKIISIVQDDWDASETSWTFKTPLFLLKSSKEFSLRESYRLISTRWLSATLQTQRLEEENNRILIEAYGLQDELTPEVPLSEITLTCNPHYRYSRNFSDEEREARLQSDTIAELISYAIGCMMGRYSLDREGLVYAHAGNEGFKALVEEDAYASFAADEDGILPLTTDNWFPDDVAARIEQFVRIVWGAETLEENLYFIADSLCLAAIKPVKKGGETSRETLRRYLSTQFFKDHMKTYKKRPIYWLFSSGKEKAFECLVYLHRYNEATLPRMRTEYVTPLLGQMAGRIERLRLQQTEASTSDAKRIGKEIDSLSKQLSELRAFDDQLKHHADMRITLDLDDGVKINYGKFGTLLSDVKAITGDKGE